MIKQVTEEDENKLMKMLISILPERDFVIPAYLFADKYGIILDCIDYIEGNPNVDDQDVWKFVLKDAPPVVIVDDDE